MPTNKLYNNDVLMNVVEAVKPKGAEAWKEVCLRYIFIIITNFLLFTLNFRYQQATGEDAVRDYESVRRHFVEKLCNNFKKPTGKLLQIFFCVIIILTFDLKVNQPNQKSLKELNKFRK